MSILTMPPPAGIPSFPVQTISVAKYHETIHLMLNRLRPDQTTNVARFTYTPNPMKKAA